MPDPAFFAQCLRGAFEDIKSAAARHAAAEAEVLTVAARTRAPRAPKVRRVPSPPKARRAATPKSRARAKVAAAEPAVAAKRAAPRKRAARRRAVADAAQA
jgi:hypothetical protein